MKHLHFFSFIILTSHTFAIEYGNISVFPDTISSNVIIGRTDSSLNINISNTSKRDLLWSIPYGDPVIATAQFHNLGLSTDKLVTGWGITTGWKNYGQSEIPDGLSDVIDIAAGDYHSLALLGDGTVRAWGDNTYGQTRIPSRIKNIIAISAGEYHNIALHENGTVSAWGSNKYGQIDVPSELQSVIRISAGYYHNIALHENGMVTVWGSNGYGQAEIPKGLDSVVAISAGVAHTLALHSDSTVTAWGDNGYGQSNVPVDLDSTVVAVSAGGDHSLALLADGTVRAWGVSTGWTFFGQTQIPPGLSDVVGVSSGKNHSIALHSDGTVTAWGKNDDGQSSIPDKLFLGIPTPDDFFPTEIPNWLEITQKKGIIQPSGSVVIPVIFNGRNKNSDTYLADITIFTNDKLNPVLSVPVIMNVKDIPFNSPPVLSKIGPQATDEDVSLQVQLHAFDAESQYVDFLVNSLSENVNVSIFADTLILDPAYNFFGEAKITVIVGDGDLIDSETITLTVHPINDTPTIDNLTISPGSPTENDDLKLTYSFVDPDNDPEGPSEIQWFRNDEIQLNLEGSMTVSGNLTECDDSWVSLVIVHDGTVTGPMTASNLVKIYCPPPEEEIVFEPEIPIPVVPVPIPPVDAVAVIPIPIPSVEPKTVVSAVALPETPSIIENTFLSDITININLFSNNKLAYGHSLNNNDAVNMSAALGADYRISDTWVVGGVLKKYGSLDYGTTVPIDETASIARSESATLIELFLNKEQPLKYTRMFVGPRLSMVQWSSSETTGTGSTLDASKFVLYSGLDFGLIIKLFSGLSLKTNLYLGNVYAGHDYIKPGSNLLNTFCGNITGQLQYDLTSQLSFSGGFYNEGSPSFNGVNFNASYSFSPRENLFLLPPADIPLDLPVPGESITQPEEPQIAITDEEETTSDESEQEKLTWREKHKGMEMVIPVPDMGSDIPLRSPTETIPVERTEVDRISPEKTSVDVTPVQRTPVEVIPVERTPVDRIPVQRTPVEKIPIEQKEVERTPVDYSQPERSTFEKPDYEEGIDTSPQFEEEPLQEITNDLFDLEFIPEDEVISVLSEEFNIVLLETDLFEMTIEDIKSVEDIVVTDEGKYLIFSKESSLAEEFRTKFSEAVKNGKPYFYWKNRKFSTDKK